MIANALTEKQIAISSLQDAFFLPKSIYSESKCAVANEF